MFERLKTVLALDRAAIETCHLMKLTSKYIQYFRYERHKEGPEFLIKSIGFISACMCS